MVPATQRIYLNNNKNYMVHTHIYIYMSISKILCNADRIQTNYSLLENLGAFILEPVSDMIMADICNNNYINVSCLRLSHVHVLK